MDVILLDLIQNLLEPIYEVINLMLNGLAEVALGIETSALLGASMPSLNVMFGALSNIAFELGISLIILKFLKKGFDIYILWADGDADADPLGLLTNFVRALAVAICFPTLYGFMVQVTFEVMNLALEAIGGADFDARLLFGGLGNLLNGLLVLICIILIIILCFQFVMRGLELFILRIGVPIACVGLLENDKGAFKAYSQKFFQSMFAVIVQLVLLRMALQIILKVDWESPVFVINLGIAIATIVMAIKTPKFLSEFVSSMGGGGNLVNTVYSGTRMVQMAKGFVKR